MNKFNIHRFGHLLRADIITNRKQHISAFLSVFSLSLLLLFFSYYKPSLYGWEIVAPSRELAADILSSRANRFFMMMFPLFMTYNLSMTFSHLLTKQQRISYIMLPASPLENFFRACCSTRCCSRFTYWRVSAWLISSAWPCFHFSDMPSHRLFHSSSAPCPNFSSIRLYT